MRRVGGVHYVAGVAERDDADADARRLVGDERPRRLLGGRHPGRREVLRLHARRDVEREDHGALPPGEVDGGLGAGQAHEEHDHPDEEDQRHARGAASRAAGPTRGRGAAMVPSSCSSAVRRRDDPHVAGDEHRHEQEAAERARRQEGHRWPRCLRKATMRSEHPHDVVVGGQVVEVDTGAADRGCAAARRVPRRLPGSDAGTAGRWCRRAAAPRSRRPASRRRPASTRPTSRGVPDADRDDLVALREHPERPLPPRLADEVGEDEDERAPADGGERRRGRARSGRWPCPRGRRGRNRSRVRRSTCRRPPRGSMMRSIALSYSTAPMRLPSRVSSRPIVAASSTSTDSLVRSTWPKRIDDERSSSSHAVSSRSSMYWRTYGTSRRAVTFQSMYRTSSCAWYSRRSAKSLPEP